MRARSATAADAAAIARIYNDGIDDRVATFETRHRSADDVERWFDGRHPIVVVEDEEGIVAFDLVARVARRPSAQVPRFARDDRAGLSC